MSPQKTAKNRGEREKRINKKIGGKNGKETRNINCGKKKKGGWQGTHKDKMLLKMVVIATTNPKTLKSKHLPCWVPQTPQRRHLVPIACHHSSSTGSLDQPCRVLSSSPLAEASQSHCPHHFPCPCHLLSMLQGPWDTHAGSPVMVPPCRGPQPSHLTVPMKPSSLTEGSQGHPHRRVPVSLSVPPP